MPADSRAGQGKTLDREMLSDANLDHVRALNEIAGARGQSLAQLALAWLLHKAPHVIPIPGTTSVEHLLEDLRAAEVKLSADMMGKLEALINQQTVHGNRYNEQSRSEVDTEEF